MNETAIHVMFEELKKSLSDINKQLVDVKLTTSESNSTCNTQNYDPRLVTDMENTMASICQTFFNMATDNISSSFRSERSRLEDFFASKSNKLKYHHRHEVSIDIKSSKTFMTIVGLGLSLLIMTTLAIHFYEEQAKYLDNDLKYRYIKSTRGIDKKGLGTLENIFEYERDEDKISKIEEYVTIYEKALSKKSENLEMHELNE